MTRAASIATECGLLNYNGAELDFDELYAWGWADLTALTRECVRLPRNWYPRRRASSKSRTFSIMTPSEPVTAPTSCFADSSPLPTRASQALDGVHFDIDPRIRFCDARLAPEGSAAAPYYIAPSEDLTRPGTTWFPTLGATSFPWWTFPRPGTTKGYPGHHLQCATSIIEADRQCRFHRLEAWTSGYGEGWALYAERLMDELGFFSDLGEEMGFLSSQALRAARVMVDIGLH